MSKLNKKLSILIPNISNIEESLIDISINALLEQVYSNIEIITVNFVSSFLDERVRNIEIKDCDVLHMCIELMKAAKGDYVSFLIPGHTMTIDYYRNMIFKAYKNNADIVSSNFVMDDNGVKFIYNIMSVPFKTLCDKEIFNSFIKQEGLNDSWNLIDNKLFRQDLIKKVLKKLEGINFISNDFLLLNYFLFKEATRMDKIETDVLILDSFFNEYELEDAKRVFDFIESDLKDEVYKNNVIQWKKLYAQRLKEQGIPTDDFFPKFKEVENVDYYSLIKTEWNDGLEKIKCAIKDESVKLVSFDIFDTLVVRPFFEPVDMFDIIDKYFRKLTNNKTATEFKNMRVDSESLARKEKKKEKSGSQEITFDDIYATMKRRYRLEDEIIQKLKKFELEQELRFCKQRNSAFELYELALYLGKKVICTSDMYLDEKFLNKLVKNCGYDNISKIYVSSSFDKTKAIGDLYRLVSDKEKIDFKNILHIGDNYISDIQNARKYGVQAFQLFKCVEVFLDKSKTNCLSTILTENLPFWIDNANGILFNAIRVVMALVANRYFDNPFRTFKEKSDYNADPYLIGYYCLGSYMFGLVKWMLDDMQGENYEKIVFMARDGYLPMECYKILKNFYDDRPMEDYLYISRKALIPIVVQNKMDFYKLIETFNVERVTPVDVAKYVNHLIEYDEDKFFKVCESNKLNPKAKFKTIEEFNLLVDLLIENFYSEEKHNKNKKILSAYFKEIYGEHSATFDIGYSARPSYFISNLLGNPIDTYFCNINHNQALRHATMGNFKLKTFFDGRPCTTGHAYELLLSALAPSCIAYDIVEDKVVPRFGEYQIKEIDQFAVKTMQNAAIDFIKDIADFFADDIDILYFQNYYMGLPFMAYMNSSKEIDKYPFSSVLFEDDFSMGIPKKMVRVWQDELMLRNQHTVHSLLNIKDDDNDNLFTGNRLVYNSNVDLQKQNKFKRLLFYLLYDRETLKRRFSEIRHHFWNRKK